ncbi:MAG: nucleotidyltransferase family protein [Rhodobacteraceae bacterium]|nr:nucleotidyltransferase family protein [Paracoccaceae bacterium]MCF8521042.1 nucleotidyltransferase family protein [Paracoccaceae bacterium]
MINRPEIDWKSTLISMDLDLHGAIVTLDRLGLQILLVVDKDMQLQGTLTDGDVRRALLRGLALDARTEDVMFRTPMVVGPDFDRASVLNLMRFNKLRQLPIVDRSGKVVGLHLWDEVLAAPLRENTVLLMAGGFGKRMMPHTEAVPKPMLQVAGKPLLQHAIERAHADGFRRFLISLHYLPDVIRDHFGDGRSFDVEIDYIVEKEPLGTAGALSLMQERPEHPMVIANGDILTDVRFSDMLEFHRSFGAAATMAVREHQYHNPFGVVQTDGMVITGFEEKPIWRTKINAGIYVLNSEALSLLRPGAHCNMPSLFEMLQARGEKTIVYPMHETWMDVGNPQDLIRANRAADEAGRERKLPV